MNICITCGGSGSRIHKFDIPKACYPIWQPGDSEIEFTDYPLARFLRSLEKFKPYSLILATGFHTDFFSEVYPQIPTLNTWDADRKPGLVSAIRDILEHTGWDSIKVLLGDTVWSDWDLEIFLHNQDYPFIFYHDNLENRYAETYGLGMDERGIDCFKRLVDSSDYMQPINYEIAFMGIERVTTKVARLGHLERAIDFSTPFKGEKKRLIAQSVMDFDDEAHYNMVNARLQLGWFD